ncbi:ribosome biosynthesis protein rrb1, partial [Quaeritorhiza haematococci]
MSNSKKRSNIDDTPVDAAVAAHNAAIDESSPRKGVKTQADETPNAQGVQVNGVDDGMGDFEDAWEDEIEEEDEGEVVIAPDSDDEEQDGMEVDVAQDDEEEDESDVKVFLPGQKLEENEELVVDNSAYDLLHSMGVEWPCLSFDIIKDSLGSGRKSFPMTTYIVAGSQANLSKDNKIYVMKMSQLHKTKHDDDDEMNDDDSDDENLDDDPILEYKTIPHFGGVNRIRYMQNADAHVVATCSETGKVHIWDISQQVTALDTPGMIPPKDPKPVYTVNQHGKAEGFGMDWSPTVAGRLLTGDHQSRIFLTNKTPTSFQTEQQPFIGHKSSVEDIQWSPSEREVFASASADKTIKIWDTRTKKKPQLSVKAHDSDVNVINWNRAVNNLLVSGSDDGSFSVWDLRNWISAASSNKAPEPAANFKWHTKAITSVEWHPTESSMIGVSGEDDQITIWDLALEADKEELVAPTKDGGEVQVPPQLLFIHQGQTHIKEIHWHRQIPGVMISTAGD